jgi:hypothetical protein
MSSHSFISIATKSVNALVTIRAGIAFMTACKIDITAGEDSPKEKPSPRCYLKDGFTLSFSNKVFF